MADSPKIFISYSWSNPDHEDWVINLAERLVSDGVDVKIDKWDLIEGQDKFQFMESSVRSEEIHRVLIILDEKYSEKANNRTGGVGTETQIISPEIYSDVSKKNFIPIISAKDENGDAYIPTFLKGRIYIDLSEQDHYEENYEVLLRNIYNRPAFSKPKLGKAPAYLFEETPISFKTSSILRSFDNQLNKNPNRINSIVREFLDKFYKDLSDFSITFTSKDHFTIGKEICENINSYTPLRNDYLNFIDKLIKSELEFNTDLILRFFEKLTLLKRPQDNRPLWSKYEFDNFSFFIHEIFIYSIAIGLNNENYKFTAELLYSNYFFRDKCRDKTEPHRFEKLYDSVDIINEYYRETYSAQFINSMADFIVKRIPDFMSSEQIINADLICYYVSVLENLKWFPITYIYRINLNFELFERLVSIRHFEKIKILFNVETVKELQDKLNHIKENDKNQNEIGYSNLFEKIIPIYKIIDIAKIGTMR